MTGNSSADGTTADTFAKLKRDDAFAWCNTDQAINGEAADGLSNCATPFGSTRWDIQDG